MAKVPMERISSARERSSGQPALEACEDPTAFQRHRPCAHSPSVIRSGEGSAGGMSRNGFQHDDYVHLHGSFP